MEPAPSIPIAVLITGVVVIIAAIAVSLSFYKSNNKDTDQ